MRLIDCHVHLQESVLRSDLQGVLADARAVGVRAWVCNGSTEADWPIVRQLAGAHAGVIPCFGLHPWYVGERTAAWRETLEGLLDEQPSAAVGEIGIDRWIEPRDEADQEAVFRAQLDIARRKERPVMIHCLRAWGWLMDVLKDEPPLPAGMLIHAYGGSVELIQPLAAMGAYFSYAGNIFEPRREKARAAVMATPIDRLLVETDAPDMLPPLEYRSYAIEAGGSTSNHPANLRAILAGIAMLRGIDEDALAEAVWHNAGRLFGKHLAP